MLPLVAWQWPYSVGRPASLGLTPGTTAFGSCTICIMVFMVFAIEIFPG